MLIQSASLVCWCGRRGNWISHRTSAAAVWSPVSRARACQGPCMPGPVHARARACQCSWPLLSPAAPQTHSLTWPALSRAAAAAAFAAVIRQTASLFITHDSSPRHDPHHAHGSHARSLNPTPALLIVTLLLFPPFPHNAGPLLQLCAEYDSRHRTNKAQLSATIQSQVGAPPPLLLLSS